MKKAIDSVNAEEAVRHERLNSPELDQIVRKTVIDTEIELGIPTKGTMFSKRGVETIFEAPTEAEQKIIEKRVEAVKEKFLEQTVVVSPTHLESDELSEPKTKGAAGKHTDLLKGANLPEVTSRIVHSPEDKHVPAPAKSAGKASSLAL